MSKAARKAERVAKLKQGEKARAEKRAQKAAQRTEDGDEKDEPKDVQYKRLTDKFTALTKELQLWFKTTLANTDVKVIGLQYDVSKGRHVKKPIHNLTLYTFMKEPCHVAGAGSMELNKQLKKKHDKLRILQQQITQLETEYHAQIDTDIMRHIHMLSVNLFQDPTDNGHSEEVELADFLPPRLNVARGYGDL
jgi:hypothetical protein